MEGVKFLHGQNVIHRDLKPKNVFFSNRPGFVLPVKIGDLGLSRRLMENATGQTKNTGDDGHPQPEADKSKLH